MNCDSWNKKNKEFQQISWRKQWNSICFFEDPLETTPLWRKTHDSVVTTSFKWPLYSDTFLIFGARACAASLQVVFVLCFCCCFIFCLCYCCFLFSFCFVLVVLFVFLCFCLCCWVCFRFLLFVCFVILFFRAVVFLVDVVGFVVVVVVVVVVRRHRRCHSGVLEFLLPLPYPSPQRAPRSVQHPPSRCHLRAIYRCLRTFPPKPSKWHR